jgi:hypothetical protein
VLTSMFWDDHAVKVANRVIFLAAGADVGT